MSLNIRQNPMYHVCNAMLYIVSVVCVVCVCVCVRARACVCVCVWNINMLNFIKPKIVLTKELWIKSVGWKWSRLKTLKRRCPKFLPLPGRCFWNDTTFSHIKMRSANLKFRTVRNNTLSLYFYKEKKTHNRVRSEVNTIEFVWR
jgi:hypothetical protein